MTIVTWPAGVPQCIMPLSPQGGLRDTRYSFETDSKAPPIERPIASWASSVYSVELTPLSVTQFEAFEAWYAGTLAYGVNSFIFAHPITGAEGVWKIMKAEPPYQVRKIGRIPVGSTARRIGVSFSIMLMPDPVPAT